MLTYLNSLNTDYLEKLEEQYRKDPTKLDPSWRYFFEGMSLEALSRLKEIRAIPALSQENLEFEKKVLELIQGYREMGYLIADVNPLDRGIKTHPLLNLTRFGLDEKDLDRVSEVGRVLGLGAVPLRTIVQKLIFYYCSPVSVELDHINDPKARQWVQKRIESNVLTRPLSNEIKKRVLEKLCEAEIFETFLHKRFVGQKRFSLEGNDVIIPMLDHLIDQASLLGTDEIIIGMAHRGRLNVLANIFHKDIKLMLAEFAGNVDANVGDGDVKYHMGFSQNITTLSQKEVHLSLMPNPSHLEAVNPVLAGVTRAKQKLKNDQDRIKTLAVVIHGDASFAGQGVVYETLNLSDLAGYTVGGTFHIIINNQVGFTTNPKESRSTPQPTDVAKMLEIPIFHVNADEPSTALRCTSLALQFRNKFKRDVVIDLIGYRRYGHNEADEPTFTQPLLYKKINSHPRVREIYANKLVEQKVITENEVSHIFEDLSNKLDEKLDTAKKSKVSPMMDSFGNRWKEFRRATDKNLFKEYKTGVSLFKLQEIGKQLLTIPENFHVHPKLKKILEERVEMLNGQRSADWGFSESLAFGSLMMDGYPIRLAGQDSERGTFSHRHAVFHDVETGEKYTPLNHLSQAKADCEIVNSPLSEYAAMGFEFGESLAHPEKLIIWEAQFGDFVNGAQIIIDQFITSSAFKWQRYSGLVLLLPHGYEGQGPEHSSGRLERFLQACAQYNIQVCNLSTPAQYFHILRRQMTRDFRLPLIIMTPKSLLRNALSSSPLTDFENGVFQEIIDDLDPSLKNKAERIVLCSGKIYYDLLEAKEKTKKEIPLIRVEQFYPFPIDQWIKILSSYTKAKEIVWCQEGPQNMEGWSFILQFLSPLLKPDQKFIYVGRSPQASTADSYMSLHLKEQKRIVQTALDIK